MFKEQMEKIKSLVVKKEGGNNKKSIENLVVFLIILIITIIAINVIWKEDKTNDSVNQSTNTLTKQLAQNDQNIGFVDEEGTLEEDLEKKLENILTKIDGVGEVSVLITYSKSNQVIPMFNEDSSTSYTQEKDTSGGTRTVEQNDSKKEIIYKEVDGQKIPITQSIIMPKIEGAIVTANGANNPSVKTNIIQAVEAVTGLATHKIQVFEMSK